MQTRLNLTVKDYMALPDGGPRYELINGDLIKKSHGESIRSPVLSIRHQLVAGLLFSRMFQFVYARQLGIVLCAPVDVIVDNENICQPDILFVSNDRLRIVEKDCVRGAPDLCIEVLSPSNRDLDIQTKRVMYARAGVIEYWIADPDANTLSVYRLQENPREPLRTLKQTETLESALFPGLKIALAEVFAD